jgi:hypothetical protein
MFKGFVMGVKATPCLYLLNILLPPHSCFAILGFNTQKANTCQLSSGYEIKGDFRLNVDHINITQSMLIENQVQWCQNMAPLLTYTFNSISCIHPCHLSCTAGATPSS